MEEERMKKKLLFLLISVFLMLSLMPVSAMDIETTDQNPQYEEYVDAILNGFYATRTDAFEMYYGESEVNNKDLFYTQTRPMYLMQDYEGIFNYVITNEVKIVEDYYYGLNTNLPNGSVSFNKGTSETRNPVTGVPLVFTVRFTGTYYKNDNNIITAINCNYTLSHNGSNNNYTVTISDKSFSQGSTGSTRFYPSITFKAVIKYSTLPQTFTYPSITLSVTIP